MPNRQGALVETEIMHGTWRDPIFTSHRLTPQVVLLAWDQEPADTTRPSRVEIGGKVVAAPVARLETLTDNGKVRHMLVIGWPLHEPISGLRLLDGDATRRPFGEATTNGAPAAEFEVATLFERLPDSSRVRVVMFLIETCRTIFRLDGDAAFAATMRELVEHVFASQGVIRSCASIKDDLVLLETRVPYDLGSLTSAIVIAQASLRRVPFPPHVDVKDSVRSGASAYLVSHAVAAGTEATVVLIGKAGIAARCWSVPRVAAPSIIEFLARSSGDRTGTADYVFECLSNLAPTDETAAALAHEVRAVASGARAPSPKNVAVDMRCCVATPAGLFLAGRLFDRSGIVRAIEFRGTRFESQIAIEDLECIREDAGMRGAMDFVALAKSTEGPPATGLYHMSLRLASGSVVGRSVIAAAASGIEARAEILRSLPRNVAHKLIERVIGPAVLGVSARRSRRPARRREIIDFGTAPTTPRASLIMPLGRDRAALVAKAGGFFLDPTLRDVELIFVLDRAAARAGAERALASLWSAFGLPSKLVLIPSSDHRMEAMANGISVSQSDTILLLDDGVIPERPGWAESLVDGLQAHAKVGLCGGRLLSGDGSIRSAGFALIDNEESIGLEAEFSGFPREFPAAAIGQRRIGVSLAICALRRAALDEVDGFTPDYLTEAWNDADFCARLRQASWDVGYAHDATAICFAESHHPTGLGSDNAARVDAWCFVQRWATNVATEPQHDANVSVVARAGHPRARSRSAA